MEKIELPENLVQELEYICELHREYGAPNQQTTVKDLVLSVLYSIADGSRRPGSWERSMLESMGLVAECDEHYMYRPGYGK